MEIKTVKELQNGYKDKKRLAAIHELPCQIIGNGLGLKASDRLTMAISEEFHTGKAGKSLIKFGFIR